MSYHTRTIIDKLDRTQIRTWFDIGYFLDHLKSSQPVRRVKHESILGRYHSRCKQGVAIVTFDLGLDGVTIESRKYASALRSLLGKDTPMHLIAGRVDPAIDQLNKSPHTSTFEYPLIKGFEKWGEHYRLLFHTKLKRGDKSYNELPSAIWNDTKTICSTLLEYIETHKIELILTANVASNPGNLSLMLALVIISELYDLNVIASNHDFYWEGGSDKKSGEKPGPRDHFFKNADISEIFSLVQILYPWNSTKWIHANINSLQSKTLLSNLGFNPFNVVELTSAINIQTFRPLLPRDKQVVYRKLEVLFKQDGLIMRPDEKKYFSALKQNKPVIISNSNHRLTFDEKTTVLLQPTRIIKRKNIEKDLVLIEQLVNQTPIKKGRQTIILLITGPISSGSDKYAQSLLVHTRALFRKIKKHNHRVFIAFKLGHDASISFDKHHLSPLTIDELYGISSLVLLPSDQEGRGLPILESAASGVPLVVNRFEPVEVYEEVIGAFQDSEMNLRVTEFPDGKITSEFGDQIYEILRDKKLQGELADHNRVVIHKRYSMEKLTANFAHILEKMFLINQSQSSNTDHALRALNHVTKNRRSSDKDIVYDINRAYIPGILQYRFLSQVKSIIDPSYFRIEQKQVFGRIFSYARQLVPQQASEKDIYTFYYALQALFGISDGKYDVELDTTFDYRYRDNAKYIWWELTEPQLFGAVVRLGEVIFRTSPKTISVNDLVKIGTQVMKDKELMTAIRSHQAQTMALDLDVAPLHHANGYMDNEGMQQYKNRIIRELQVPMQIHDWRLFHNRVFDQPQRIVIFPGDKHILLWELFIYDRMAKEWSEIKRSFMITFSCRETTYSNDVTITEFEYIMNSKLFINLSDAYERGNIKIVPVGSRSTSVDLFQISTELNEELLKVKQTGGHVLSKGEQNYFSLDLIDVNSFRFCTLHSLQGQAIFNMPHGTRVLQFVPAGLRTYFGFPLTVETPVQFSRSLNTLYDQHDIHGNRRILTELKYYLDAHGTSLRGAIQYMNKNQKGHITIKRLAGKYKDGYGWTGVSARLKSNVSTFSYHILSSKSNKTLPQFVQMLERRSRAKVVMGWNGGYILNNELVGKLNISEDFIGTPLGLVVSNGRVLSLPLFNRPVFAVKKNGKAFIERIELNFSGKVFLRNKLLFEWKKRFINPSNVPENHVAIYTPMSGLKNVPGSERILVVIGGRKVFKVIYPDEQNKSIELFPGGITFSLPLSMKKRISSLKPGVEVRFGLDLPHPWSRITDAIEAGPLLLSNKKNNINLDIEGWKTNHSVATQAARRDRINERGPRIGCGITRSGDLICAVVESRIRESVGATYEELADILLAEGAVTAMGFDPGGSASLWAPGGVMNIVPYTSTYNQNPLTGKPEPRPVASAVLMRTKVE